MNFSSIKVLLVGNEDDFTIIRKALCAVGLPESGLDWVRSYSAGQISLSASRHDICLVNYELDFKTGVEFMQNAIKEGVETPFVIISVYNDSQISEALNAGAMDCLAKSELQPAILWRALRYVIERNKSERRITPALAETTDTSSNQAQLIARLSHELRTPMNGVVGMLDLLADTALNAKQKEYLTHARGAANSMFAMIDRWLDVNPEDTQAETMIASGKKVDSRLGRPDSHRFFNVLLADDSKVTRKVFTHLLEKNGHRVVAVGDGYEAVSCYMRESFDIVLMDLQMPRMSGPNAAKLIRSKELSGKPHTPILALTATESREDIEQCLQAGMDGCLHKNIASAELLEALAIYAKSSVGAERNSDSSKDVDLLQQEGSMVSAGDTSGLKTVLAHLTDACKRRDEALFENYSHSLKVLAAQANMPQLVDEAFRIQLAFRRGDMKKVKMLLTSLSNILNSTEAEKGFKIDMQ